MKVLIPILLGLLVVGCGKGDGHSHPHDHDHGGDAAHEDPKGDSLPKKASEEILVAGVWDTPIGFSLFFSKNIEKASGLNRLMQMAPGIYADKKGEQKYDFLFQAVSALVGAGEFDKAIEVAGEFDQGESKANVLFTIAKAQADAAKPKEALETLTLAEKALPGDKSEDSSYLVSAIEQKRILLGGKEQVERHLKLKMEEADKDDLFELISLGKKLFKINKKGLALEAYRHCVKILGDIEDKKAREYYSKTLLVEIAEGLAAAGDIEFAMTTFKNALETVQQIDDPEKRSVAEITVLRRTAAVMIKAGKKPEALVDLKKSLNLAEKLDAKLREEGSIEGSLKADALLKIATALAGAGEKKLAQETFEQAIKAAHQIKPATTFNGDDGGKVIQLKSIALAQAESGDQEKALETLEQISQLMQAAKDVETNSTIMGLSDLALIQIQLGRKTDAKKTVESVSRAINEIKGTISFATPIDDPARNKPVYLYDLAKLQIKLGDKQQAMKSLTQVLQLERREPNAFAKGATYEEVAIILIAEPVPGVRDEYGEPVLRMKKEFTADEKQLARKFAKVLQGK